MGYALAERAVALEWEVDLVSGPVALKPAHGVRIHPVVSVDDMFATTEPLFRTCDVLFMVAAVSDYRPVHRAAQKMKKTASRMAVDLVRTPDILSTLAAGKDRQVLVGFAAETNNLEGYARGKLADKGLDWIVANDISRPEVGMEVDDNRVIMFSAAGVRMPFGPAPKSEVADFILETVRASVESARAAMRRS
jgi:phosphopantothenoylcysteine decarboxylase/phosphopantothenate--cysteine ligase